MSRDEEAFDSDKGQEHAPIPLEKVDHDSPHDFSRVRKWVMTVLLALCTLTTTLCSSIFSSTIVVTAQEFHTSETVMLLGVSLFVLGFALGISHPSGPPPPCLISCVRSAGLGPSVRACWEKDSLICRVSRVCNHADSHSPESKLSRSSYLQIPGGNIWSCTCRSCQQHLR